MACICRRSASPPMAYLVLGAIPMATACTASTNGWKCARCMSVATTSSTWSRRWRSNGYPRRYSPSLSADDATVNDACGIPGGVRTRALAVMSNPEVPNAAVDDANDWSSRRHVHSLVLMTVTVVGLYLCYRMASPFLPALAWALALALLLVPMQRWLEPRLRSP